MQLYNLGTNVDEESATKLDDDNSQYADKIG